MTNDKPISIVENGHYNTFIQDQLIPGMIEIIEKSGLSFADARRVPKELEKAIENAISGMLIETRFKNVEISTYR